MGFGKGKGFSPVVEPPVISEPGTESNDCQLEHTHDSMCQYWNVRGQTFTPDHDYVAVGLSLLLTQWALDRRGPLVVKLELPAANCWEGEVLWSQALYSTYLPDPGDHSWTHFTLPGISLSKDTVYLITVHTTPGWYRWVDGEWEEGEAQAIILWRYESPTNPYPRGRSYYGCNYQDGSGIWDTSADSDQAFCIEEQVTEPEPIVDKEVAAGNDDCTTYKTTIELALGFLRLDYATLDVHAYFRFLSIRLLKMITITKAYIDLQALFAVTEASSLRILGIKQTNTAAFSTQADADARPVTDAYVDWTPGAWAAGEWYGRTNDPQDIKAIIQEIVNQAGWDLDNALAIKIINTAQATGRYPTSFEGGYPAKLHIEYEE